MPKRKLDDPDNLLLQNNIIAEIQNNSSKHLLIQHASNSFFTQIIAALKNNHSVTTLIIQHSTISSLTVKIFGNLMQTNTFITDLTIHNKYLPPQFLEQIIAHNSTMTSINFSGCYLYTSGAKAIAKSLNKNTVLSTLILCNNNIGTEGIKDICNALKLNKSVTNINIGWNTINVEGILAVAQVINTDTSLSSLSIPRTNRGSVTGEIIAEAMVLSKFITFLDISHNSIGYEGSKAFGDFLRVNQTLKSLNFSNNYLMDAGATEIANALLMNTSLTELNISRNHIGALGALTIANVMKINHSVTALYCAENETGVIGARAMAELIRSDTALNALDISFNLEEGEKIDEIIEAVKVNQNLKYLNIYNPLADFSLNNVLEAIKQNKSLTAFVFAFEKRNMIEIQQMARALTDNKFIISIMSDNKTCIGYKLLEDAINANRSLVKDLANFLITKFDTPKSQIEVKDWHYFKFFQKANPILLGTNLRAIYETKFTNKNAVNNKIDNIKTKVENFIKKNFFHLLGICKTPLSINKLLPYVNDKDKPMSGVNDEESELMYEKIEIPDYTSSDIVGLLGGKSLWEVVLTDKSSGTVDE